ncbi:hypothetical protein [Litoribacillus peritrichatus]|uniref:DUF4440 domain-containing protein n=1 Tax=Litoribacillus peritrichatus TaxID=718191 RepID=A0ABP7ME41_9GAMM
MKEHIEELRIVEAYLTDMLEADRDGDYDAFIKHFDDDDLEGFTKNTFLEDVELMREDLGAYKDRSFLGSLQGFKTDSRSNCLRFVWRATYEKNEALIILGIHEKDGVWLVNENVVSK